jgi:predicted hotdog family 3-hydroxylacyl-ACP dehydratase
MTVQASMPEPGAVIPHVGDAVLLDDIVLVEEARLTASLTVRPGTAFSDVDGSLPPWMGPEIMAQAIAAYAGERSLRRTGRRAPFGLLLGIRNYQNRLACFAPGGLFSVEVVRSSEDEYGRGVFDCRILQAQRTVASGTLTVYQPQEASADHLEALLHG